ncbi:Chaperone DnaJ [Gossypium australe]|uniref:Chaperone DnaJ n=1 Tax=Gossypium australe TaxID=47621 RepID=A0A5B6UEC9_9ROSI|nr:Chaperone DnaJ [Gossypium australe]
MIPVIFLFNIFIHVKNCSLAQILLAYQLVILVVFPQNLMVVLQAELEVSLCQCDLILPNCLSDFHTSVLHDLDYESMHKMYRNTIIEENTQQKKIAFSALSSIAQYCPEAEQQSSLSLGTS